MSRNKLVLLVLCNIAVVLVVVTTIFILDRLREDNSLERAKVKEDVVVVERPSSESVIADEVSEGRVQVTLFVVDSSGRSLVPAIHEILIEPNVQDQAKEVVRLLLQHSGTFPQGVELHELFITSQGMAFVDLSQDVVSKHPGGTSAEELTVYSLSNTLIMNFPAIQLVKILVEGREVKTLAGHLDLTLPYGRHELSERTDNPGV